MLQSATVNGSTLTLTYNEALKTTNAPAASRFSVAGTASATTVTAVGFKSGDATSVELTLSPAVTAGDSGITVSYTKGNDANPAAGCGRKRGRKLLRPPGDERDRRHDGPDGAERNGRQVDADVDLQRGAGHFDQPSRRVALHRGRNRQRHLGDRRGVQERQRGVGESGP